MSPQDQDTITKKTEQGETILFKKMRPPAARRPSQPPAWLNSSLEKRHAAEKKELMKWMHLLTVQELRSIAKWRGWKLKGTRKANIVTQVVEHAVEPDDIRRAVEREDDPHRRVLRGLVILSEHSPHPSPELVERIIWPGSGADGNISYHVYSFDLCAHGLAIHRDTIENYYKGVDYVPHAFARHFPPVLGDDVASSDDVTAAEIALADPYPFIRAFGQVMMLLGQSTPHLRDPLPRPVQPGIARRLGRWDYDLDEVMTEIQARRFSLPGATLSIPPPRPHLPDDVIAQLAPLIGGETRLEFAYALMVAAGIIYTGSPVTFWKRVYDRFMMHNELEQRAILARTYFQMTNWSALWEVIRNDERVQLRRSLDVRPGSLGLNKDLMRFRRLLLCALASLPDGKWIAWRDFLRVMRIIWPEFDHTVWEKSYWLENTPRWFLAYSDDGSHLDTWDTPAWDWAQGAFIRQVISGPLNWLGLADLALDEQGEPVAFRLHGLGDLFWDRVEVAAAPPHVSSGQKTVSDASLVYDGDIIRVVPSAIGTPGHNLLALIATLESTGADWFVYRLDADVAYRTFTDGMTFDEIVARWEESLPLPMPEGVRDALRRWWETYGRVRVYRDLTIIEFGDDYALREMRAVTPLDEYLIAEISPRLVVIARQGIEPLRKALEKAGYTPNLANVRL